MGFLEPLYEFFGVILAFFYSLVPSRSYGLGVAIILMTLLVMLALFPLTAKQAKSQIMMQRVQPEIKRIQAKYKGDRQKMNEEVMRFYQENKINPLAGCLPLLVQIPIFISLFHLLRSPFEYVPRDSKLYEAFCGNVGRTACDVAPNLPKHLDFLGLDLSLQATKVPGGVIDALPYFVLVALVILSSYYQVQQTQRRSPQINPQMAIMMKVLPVGFGVFSLYFPAGLVLYYLVQNLFRIGQQQVILTKITGPAQAAAEAIDAKSSEPRASSGGAKPGGPPTPSTGGGGLRKLFQLPAPSGGTNGSPKPGAGGASGSNDAGRAESGSTRPQPGARRTNKKRRRR